MSVAVMVLIGVVLLLLATLLVFRQLKQEKLPGKVMTVLGEGVPMVAFLVVFVTFMLTIISRYVLRIAIPWSYEVSILGYMYCMFFGSGIAIKRDEHVVFSLLYDKLSPTGKMISKLLYNAILITLICVAFVPCFKSVTNMRQVTGILKMPYKVVFAPFLWMLVECVARSLISMVDSVKDYKAAVGKEAQA